MTLRAPPTPEQTGRPSRIAIAIVIVIATLLTASAVAIGTFAPGASAVFLDRTTPVAAPLAPPRPTPTWSVVRDPASAAWSLAMDRLVNGSRISVAVGVGRRIVFSHLGSRPRLPASNEKLLISMAALERFGAAHRFPTIAASTARMRSGVLGGDLWVIGGGDPGLTTSAMHRLALRLRKRGLREVRGAVIADTAAFDRGWWAPGWIPGLSRAYVARPTALALDGNLMTGAPEAAAARGLHDALLASGVRVGRPPAVGRAPRWPWTVAQLRSDPLAQILEHQNHGSVNFDAEMLTKALGAAASGGPGSTASGARAIEAWGRTLGVGMHVFDGSGLSHRDRISTASLASLLLAARHEPWAPDLLRSLPGPGEGTLAGRLAGAPVHAKTGTLFVTPVSALSGYVRTSNDRLVAFSVLSRGLTKSAAVAIEDAVVRILANARVG